MKTRIALITPVVAAVLLAAGRLAVSLILAAALTG